ncbi:MAG: GNAT family N-acetyltransferase [Fidelibacterota bacterium]
MTFHPLTPDRWSDLEKLFGPRGAYGGCWCMWWRETRREFEEKAGEGNRKAFQTLVASGEVPGILAYEKGDPVGWCSVCPRESLPSLNRSRVLKRIDDTPVWSIVCFYVSKEHRNEGMMSDLIDGAIQYVKSRGGKVVEAYPTVDRGRRLPPVSSYMGIPSAFENAGFKECARPSRSRVVMRYTIP